MAELDLVVRNGTVVTAVDTVSCDIGVREGRIVALGEGLGGGAREIDATGKLVLPGGIDSHCHIDQLSSMGVRTADDFNSGTVSAAFGGNTTIIPFAAQQRGQSLRDVVADYHERATPKAVIDYAFHLIISDPSEQVLNQELPALIRDGYTSFKVFMTYEKMRLNDRQLLDVLSVARREGALMMVHAENDDVISWIAAELLEQGHRGPKFHAISHAQIAESEATHRAIRLSELTDVPLLVVHVSAEGAMDEIRRAQDAGLRVYGETCPQYLFLTKEDLDLPGADGAMFCCSPPPRDSNSQEAMWRGLRNGTFQVFSSDHAPYRYDETGKLSAGPNPSFKEVANGLPGIELRLPLLFTAGVQTGRLTLNQFVALASTNAAKIYGLDGRKGSIAVGMDADLAIWDPDRTVTVTAEMMHDNTGYTPYEGRVLEGWPETVVSRGRVIVENAELHVEPGSGQFLRCDQPEPARPLGRFVPEVDPARNFGVKIIPDAAQAGNVSD